MFPDALATPLLFEVPAVPPPAAGPDTAPPVSDVEPTACVDELVLLLFAADADFVSLPLQATAAVAIAIEKRIERFIFRG